MCQLAAAAGKPGRPSVVAVLVFSDFSNLVSLLVAFT